MGILLKKTEIRDVEFDISYPSFYKRNELDFIAFYAEDKTVKVYINNGLYQLARANEAETFYHVDEFINGTQITEEEFNDQLAKAVFMIAGVELARV